MKIEQWNNFILVYFCDYYFSKLFVLWRIQSKTQIFWDIKTNWRKDELSSFCDAKKKELTFTLFDQIIDDQHTYMQKLWKNKNKVKK